MIIDFFIVVYLEYSFLNILKLMKDKCYTKYSYYYAKKTYL